MSCEGERQLQAIASKYNVKPIVINNDLIAKLIDDEIIEYLSQNIISDFQIEIFLTSLRKSLLNLIVEDNIGQLDVKNLYKFLSALSQQCFNTEYIFQVSVEEEINLLKNLQDITWLKILMIACYKNIRSEKMILEFVDSKNSIPSEIKKLIKIQVNDNQKENELKSNVKKLGELAKDISDIVKHHYEENPYPRWFKTNNINEENFKSFANKALSNNLKNFVLKTKPEHILVIGCGTGLLSIEHAKRFPKAKIISIDLSLNSLAYATRMALEMKADNIEFIQMDLMNIYELNCEFDFIDCIGVLSHVDNPHKAYKTIIKELSNNGLFRFSLYSQLGRKHIQETAEYIHTHNYSDSEESIRQLRYELMEIETFEKVSELTDFYYISGVRDLFFHQYEKHYNLMDIKQMLRHLNCQFLGLEIMDKGDENISQKYKYLNSFMDMNLWHEFELSNPETFKNDYVIWLQKND